MKLQKILFIFSLLVAISLKAQTNLAPQVIPSIQQWEGKTGYFTFSENTPLIVDKNFPQLESYISVFSNDLQSLYNFRTAVTLAQAKPQSIFFTLSSETAIPEEGYRINIDENIIVTASSTKGIFWATRTLLQMLENGGNRLPKGIINDFPMYSHRGFMLDVGRKFFTIDYLRDYIKILSYYKINEFQIHLNDNGFKVFYNDDWDKTYSAFRLQSDVFPGLAAKDGHYTKDEFRDLQKMGMLYGVNVIPEIDVPAHSLAFTHYKPEIGSDKYGRDHLDLYHPETYKFVDALYAEYLSGENPVFVGADVHIGTDEYDKGESEKYREFTDRYLKYIQKLGKNVRMWGGLRWLKGETPVHSENVVVNAWSYDWVNPELSLKEGYKLISTCDTWLYIVPAAGYYRDFLDEKWLYEEWTPEKVNRKETLPEGTKGLLGGMFAVWNDHCGNGISQQDVHIRTLPAVKVLSEKMWKRNTSVNFDTFKKLSDRMGEAPQVNLSGKVTSKTNLVIHYALNSKKERDLSENGYNELQQNKIGISKKDNSLVFKSEESFIKTPILEIGYDYRVDFNLFLNPKTIDDAILFEGRDSKVIIKKERNQFQIGFSRDGYTYYFAEKFDFEKWYELGISGDYKGTSLYVNGKQSERLEGKTYSTNNGKNKIYIQQTLVFPLQYIGSSNQKSFQGKIKNLKVIKL
ncbi:family 20 glycosylhydrolase [Capnocytophaga canimorsus]|uniref:family 20 glycosylhydrolase n=1 Tax=Capnocytophaga canimorsus TaxID=28188 RepID=UPI000BB17F52|nr:family 20 glycosylhydrolase [Capnocytophaga canimorsus]ATA76838.1 glycoside hydrolase [Capnocytophaga canimorsus]PJI84036.1 hexosaminidase [Capnocytophaga canimorsus]STA72038.1 Beta-hexosaminidase [Capnocytophaga canimorsus]